MEKQEAEGLLDGNDSTPDVFGIGPCMVVFDGDFGGGEITINQRVNGSFVPVTATTIGGTTTDVTFSEDGSQELFPEGISVVLRATMAGATSPSVNFRIVFADA